MTSLFSARRRAEEFAAVVDGAAAPGPHPAFAELTEVVGALRSHQQPVLRDEFAADLRARLMAEAATVLTPANANLVLRSRPRTRREHRLVAAASAVVLIGGSAGMAAAAERSLPGEALYPIKRAIEHAQSGLSTSSADRGRDLLNQAGDRLAEVSGLLAADSATSLPQIPATIDDFTAEAQEGSGLMMSSFQDTQDPATIVTVREFAANSLHTLQDMARTAPADSQDELAAAAMALSAIDQQARDLCATCAPGLADLAVPPTFLAAADVHRALASVDAAHLDNSHPVTVDRAALQEALGTSAVGASTDAQAPTAPQTSTSSPTPELLPKTNEQVKKSSTDVGNTLGSAVDGVTGGLDGTVETLLPDPTSTTLP